ncbi:MAG: alpha/beta hydrolase [Chloroflexota bacterium]
MSSIVTEQGILHYETLGRGAPVILLHGWINSWDVWRESMIYLATEKSYRVYALDFWGFGASASSNGDAFDIQSYSAMVAQFIDRLGIRNAPIIGHSMGGTVALNFGLKYPSLTTKIGIVGSPIQGSSLNFFLKLSGYGWIANLVWKYPVLRDIVMQLILAQDSAKIKEMLLRDVQRANMESFFKSIGDLRHTDLREDLKQIESPILGVFGKKDNIVSPVNAHTLLGLRPDASVTVMEHSRHFPMLDESEKFLKVLTCFLESEIPEVEIP